MLERGIVSDDIDERLMELNSQKADLLKQISTLENRKPSLSKERIAFWLTNFLNDGDINDVEYQRRIIDSLVNKVFVFDGEDGNPKKIIITYNTTASTKSTLTINDVKSSFITGIGAPIPTIPNFFVIKNCFGLVIEIPSGV